MREFKEGDILIEKSNGGYSYDSPSDTKLADKTFVICTGWKTKIDYTGILEQMKVIRVLNDCQMIESETYSHFYRNPTNVELAYFTKRLRRYGWYYDTKFRELRRIGITDKDELKKRLTDYLNDNIHSARWIRKEKECLLEAIERLI